MSTAIQWTNETWNPVTGCTKVSQGCKNCYAEKVADRFWKGRKFTDVRTHADRLDAPLHWRKPRKVFVNSMSDLFHEDVPDEFIDRVFAVMALAPKHTFQVLTKRPERMRDYLASRSASIKPWDAAARTLGYALVYEHDFADINRGKPIGLCPFPLPNVWLGVSVEDQRAADERIPLLLQTPAAVRFLSCEPLLSDLALERWLRPSKRLHLRADVEGMLRTKSFSGLTDESGKALSRQQAEKRLRELLSSGVRFLRVGECDTFDPSSGCPGHAEPKLDWVIVGGESGPGARCCSIEWIRSIVRQCRNAGVPCFVKQLGRYPCTEIRPEEVVSMEDGSIRRLGAFWSRLNPDGSFFRPRHRKGGDPSEWPEDLRVRQFPEAGEVRP